MYRLIIPLICCSLLVISLVSCENCGPTAEPIATLSILTSTATRLDTVYAPGSLRPLPVQQHVRTFSTFSHQLNLPVNLTADSTRYVVQFGGQRDTITVFYQRKTDYRNRNCGYVLDLYAPVKSPTARVSRGRVTSVSYLRNTNGTFLSSPQNTSIYLSVGL